jgi:Family of unknown function (DUF5681)
MFVKGQSGNPSGRPKVANEVKELAREFTIEAVNRLAEWMRSDNAKASVAACIALLDRGYGKPTQPLAGDSDGPPVRIERLERVIVRANPDTPNG